MKMRILNEADDESSSKGIFGKQKTFNEIQEFVDSNITSPNALRQEYDNGTLHEKMALISCVLAKKGVYNFAPKLKAGGGQDLNNLEDTNDFNPNFVNEWVNSMKWEEICNSNNAFMTLLKEAKTNDAPFVKNKSNFLKAYNAYANNVYGIDFVKNSGNDNILFNDSLYNQDVKSVAEILNLYCPAWDESLDEYDEFFDALKHNQLYDDRLNEYGNLKKFFMSDDNKTIKEWIDIKNEYNDLLKSVGGTAKNNTIKSKQKDINDKMVADYNKLNNKDQYNLLKDILLKTNQSVLKQFNIQLQNFN